MLPPHGASLATDIVTSHFGDLIGRVCGCLLQRGTLTLQDLLRYTEMTIGQLRKCLLVLIQQNCVQTFSMEKSSGFGVQRKAVTHYMALFDNILHRMRFPKFLAIVAERFDRTAESIVEGLFQHGRLTLEQILMRAMSTRSDGNIEGLRSCFATLVQAHFIERCPRAEPFLETPENDPAAKRAKSAGVELTVEQKALKAASLSEAERFLFNTNTVDENSQAADSANHVNPTSGQKRKHEALEKDDPVISLHDQEVLWRPNFEEFIRCCRNKASVEKIRSRFDLGCATVLEAFLDATRSSEQALKELKTVSLSLDALMQEVMGRRECPQNIEQVRAALDQLGASLSMEESDIRYTIDLRRIIEDAQNSEVESIVLRRYGENAFRIFRFLVRKNCLVETERISEETLIDKKETVHILYKLFKDNYLHMEKIDSREMQGQFLLWKVMMATLWEHLLNDMFHATSNLRQRISHEILQEHEVVTRPRNQLDEVLLKRFQRVIKVKAVLEASLLKLDDAIMLFHDF